MSLGSDTSVLLVIDVQYDFCPGGSLAVPQGDEVVPVINALLPRAAHAVATQDWHPAGHSSFASSHAGAEPMSVIDCDYGKQVLWPDHCVQGSAGAVLHGELNVSDFELVLRKGFRAHIDSYSAFFENDRRTATGLSGYLRERGIGSLYLCGLATDFCVAWSALDARAQGFEVTLVEDACRAIDVDDSLVGAMNDMHEAGVIIADSDTLT